VNLRWSVLGGGTVITTADALTRRISPIVLLGTWSITLIVLAVAQVRLHGRTLDAVLVLVQHLGRDATRIIIRRHGEVEIHTVRDTAQVRRRGQAPPRRQRRRRRRPGDRGRRERHRPPPRASPRSRSGG
jgi:hypothetical protein